MSWIKVQALGCVVGAVTCALVATGCSDDAPSATGSDVSGGDESKIEWNGPVEGRPLAFPTTTCPEASLVSEVAGESVAQSQDGGLDEDAFSYSLDCGYILDSQPRGDGLMEGARGLNFQIFGSVLSDLPSALEAREFEPESLDAEAEGFRDAPEEFGGGAFETWVDGARLLKIILSELPDAAEEGAAEEGEGIGSQCVLWVLGAPEHHVYEIRVVDIPDISVPQICEKAEEFARLLGPYQ